MFRKILHLLKGVIKHVVFKYSDTKYLLIEHKRLQQKFMRLNEYNKSTCCFVIGNGPSLSISDLEVLNKNCIPTFASNKIYLLYDKTNWRPFFYTITDDGLVRNNEVISNLNKHCAKALFFRSQHYCYLKKYLLENMCFFHSKYSRRLLNKQRFSDCATKVIYSIATVTYFNLQIAVALGYKYIFLLGCDNKYRNEVTRKGKKIYNNVNSYMEARYDSNNSVYGNTMEMDIAYKAAKSYSDNSDVHIYNATRGGFLEIFERISFDDAVKICTQNDN
jgi:hypothetical protein